MSNLIAGLDEVGMGCLAGPVVVCVAAFPKGQVRIAGVRDSKVCSKSAMRSVLPRILESAKFVGLGFATVEEINDHGIADAWQLASHRALEGAPDFDLLIVDGTRPVADVDWVQKVEPKADATYWQCSAASILAKLTRDEHMTRLAEFYSQYGWESNVGYGSSKHREAILKYGLTKLHRSKYVRKVTAQQKPKHTSRFKVG